MAEKRYIEVIEAAQYADVFFADTELEARCAELMNAVDNYIGERDKAMTENEHLRKRVQQQECSLSYLTGIKDTVEVIFGRKFDD